MKKFLLLTIMAAMTALNTYAKFEGNGYYRIQNYKTTRYLYVLDNRADINYGATTVDMNGVELWLGEDRKLSDPSTVLYIEQVGSEYDISAQGTSIHKMGDVYLKLRYNSSKDAYYAYGTSSGMTKYLGDPSTSMLKERSYLKDSASGDYRLWYIKPISNDGNNYFGLLPSLTVEGKLYAPFYGDFPVSAASEGVKFYYVSVVDNDKAVVVMKEIQGTVPRATPLFALCAGSLPADNKLNIGGSAVTVSGNKLSGNYFDNEGAGGHYNRLPNDKATMRMLGVTSAGKLGYVVADTDFIPRNQSYLKVSASAPAEFTVVTEEEYAEMGGVDLITVDEVTTFDVYNTLGVKVRSGVSSLEGLPTGYYIVNGRTILVK